MSTNFPELKGIENFNFILASTSPRRLELLKNNLGVANVSIKAPLFDENFAKDSSPEDYVLKTALEKGKSILSSSEFSHERRLIILSSDTVIASGGKIYEKPGDEKSQFLMFQEYKKNVSMKAITAICIHRVENGEIKLFKDVQETVLHFDKNLSDDFLWDYIKSGEGLRVAGGFKYQERGSLLFNGISGDYFNVVGLPLKATYSLIQKCLN